MNSTNQVYRITEARELRGLTVAELASAIGITRQTVYKYENGTQIPGHETMERICNVLDFPYPFFSEPRKTQDISDRTVFFRDMKTNQEKSRKMAHRWLQLLCDQVNFYESKLDLPEVRLPDFDLPEPCDLTNEDIDIAAEKLRRFWGLGDGPINNVTQLLENNGFIILRKYLEAEKMDACSLVMNGRPIILINTYKQTCARDIMNLAHELGHVILHMGISTSDLTHANQFELLEDQAWRFAKAFLMPPVVFQNEVGYPTLSHFITLKRRWRVSIAAMIMYCCDLGIIDESRKQYFFREMTRQKIRKEEPLDSDLQIEHSSILRDCEKLFVEHGLYTKRELYEESKLNESDYCELINVPNDYLAPVSIRPKLRLI